MIPVRFVSGPPAPGTLYYVESDYAFDYVIPGGSGSMRTSLVLGTLQLEVSTLSGWILYAWGYCPRTSWRVARLEPPEAVRGRLFVEDGVSLDLGISLVISDGPDVLVSFDENNGWLMVSAGAPPPQLVVEVANGVLVGVTDRAIVSVWLHPTIVSTSPRL